MGFTSERLLTRGAVVALNSHWSEWREAEALAHTAERAAFAEAMQFLEGRGPAPAPEQWEQCKRLRRAADDSFQLVIEDWNAIGKTRRPAPYFGSFPMPGRPSAA
jgi:hypothetical protein